MNRHLGIRKYRVIYQSVVMENLQYAASIAMGFISFAIIIFVFIQLWNYMYSSPGELIAGYNKAQMIWYVMITETIWFGAPSHMVTRHRQSQNDRISPDRSWNRRLKRPPG